MNKSLPLFPILVRLHIITPQGLWQWTRSFIKEGITLMAMLRFAAHFYSEKEAITSDERHFTYSELYSQAQQLAFLLQTEETLQPNMRVALLCRNHALSVLLLPALSRLGVHVKLLNTDMNADKIEEALQRGRTHLLIYDSDLGIQQLLESLPCRSLSSESLYERLSHPTPSLARKLPHILKGPEISVLTGGTSGHYTEAGRRPAITQFLSPFFALLQQIGIHRYKNVLLALPFYHGFGLATLIVSLLMGKRIYLMWRFQADEALRLIRQEAIEVVPIVPAMLYRMWQSPHADDDLRSVRCFICGGDRLDKKWIHTLHERLGKVLYNLYGTSEAGFFLLATPHDLDANEETTIGRPIRGVRCEIRNADTQGIGTLWVRSSWAMNGRKSRWQSTGDLAFRNNEGYYFHRGRADGMVVCGGENVYPSHVEHVLMGHPHIIAARVYPVPHPAFGQVLHAQVELQNGLDDTPEMLKSWLNSRLSRAEMPHHITLQAIELLSTGKPKR